MQNICRKGDAEDQIDKAIRSLGIDGSHVLLEYVREWNTKPKLCHVAQIVLFRFFNIFSPNEIIEVLSAMFLQVILALMGIKWLH